MNRTIPAFSISPQAFGGSAAATLSLVKTRWGMRNLFGSFWIFWVVSFGVVGDALGQTLYWGGTSAQSWTATSGTRWALTEPTYTVTWVSGRPAVFNVVNSTITGASTNFSSITANENVTVTASGTLGTGGTVASISVASGKTFNMGGQALSTAAGTGFIKNGAGTYVVTTGASFTGGFSLNSGTMIVGGVNSMGAGGALTINGGVLSANSSTARDFTGKFTSGITIGGDFQIGELNSNNSNAGDGNLIFSNNTALGSSTTRIITIGGNGTYTLGGIISGASSNLTINANSGATGTLLLSGSNTYTGGTTINGGILSVSSINNGGSASNLGQSTSAAGNLVLGGGTLQYTGASASTNRAFTLTTGTSSSIEITNAANTLTMSGAGANTTGGLDKIGPGTLLFSGANAYTGGTIISAGTLTLGGAGVLADAGAITLNGGTLRTGTGAGFSETVGTLDLQANSTIALGTGVHTLTFAASNAINWAGGTVLTITGWTGGYDGTSSATAGKIFIGSTASGLTAAQEAQIQFFDGTNNIPAKILSTGEVVPSGKAYYARANGNWNVNSTWSNISPSGASATSFPTSGDIVIISGNGTNGFTVTVNITNAACANLQLGGIAASTNGTLTFAASGSPKLTVSGAVTVGGSGSTNANRSGTITFVSGSTLEAGSVILTQSTAGSDSPGTITMTSGSTLITGSLAVGEGAATWTPGGGTVELNASNTLPTTVFTSFNNLTLSAGTTSFGANTNAGTLSINNGAVANLGTGLTHTSVLLTLGGVDQSSGSWGGTSSGAMNINTTYFATSTGILNIGVFSSSGTFTVPAGVTSITVEAWGGGGKGGTRGTPDGAAGGGGGGAYARSVLSVTPGQVYDVFIGAGSTTTSAGGDSRFRLQPSGADLIRAVGGNSVADNSTSGVLGGLASASLGDVTFNGGRGGNVTGGGNGGGGGSSGGTASAGNYTTSTNTSTGGSVAGGGSGGNGSTTDDVPGSPGISPGGAGGGARRNNGTVPGGAGADGQITISWVICTPPTNTTITPSPSPVCQNATLNLSVTAVGGSTYTWAGNGINNTNSNATTAVPTATGSQTYTVTVTNSGGCSATGTVAVTVNAVPTNTTITPSPSPVCQNTTLNLSVIAVGGSTYNWSGNGINNANSNATTAVPTVSGSQTYSVTVTTTATGCTATGTVAVTVNAAPTNTTITPSPSPVCQNATLSLSVTSVGGSTYNWAGNGINNTNSNATTAVPTVSGSQTYSVTVTTTATGCTATGTVAVTVNAAPTNTTITPSPSPVCQNATLNLSVTSVGGSTYNWAGNGINNTNSNATTAVPTVSGSQTYSVTVTTTATGCTATGTVAVTVNAAPANPTNPTSNSPQCANAGVTLTRAGSPPGGETWYWQTTSTGTSTANSGTTFLATTSGTYYIRSQDNTTLCWSAGAGSLAVIVNPNPTAGTSNLVGDPCYANVGSVKVEASGGTPPYTVSWTPTHGSPTSPQVLTNSGDMIMISGLTGGQNYIFTVIDSNGCQMP